MKQILIITVATFLFFTGCSDSPVGVTEGKAQVGFKITAQVQANSTYKITITGAGMDTIGPSTYAGGQTISIYVPGGTARRFHFERYNSVDLLTDTAVTIMDIVAGKNVVAVTLVAVSAPQITAGPQSLTVKPGASAGFGVVATGTRPFSYRWQRDGVDVPVGGTDSGYTITAAIAGDSGAMLRCIVRNRVSADTSLSALLKVTVNVFTVTYSGNGSTGGNAPVDAKEYEAGDLVTVLGNTGDLTKTGYVFAGWNTKADGSGTTYQADSTLTMDTTGMVLFAVWGSYSYTVKFDGQGAETGPVPDSMTVNSPATTVDSLPKQPVKKGNIFGGWYTLTNGGGIRFLAATKVVADIIVYAKWTPGVSWTEVDMGIVSTVSLGRVVVGKGRGDDTNCVYTGECPTSGAGNGDVYEFKYSVADAKWVKVHINPNTGDQLNTIAGLAIEDVHNDGTAGIYASGYGFSQVIYQSGVWRDTVIDINVSNGIQWNNGIAVGSGRNNNYNRVYVADWNRIVEISYDFGNWTGVEISTNTNVNSVVVAQGRNDGINRLYASIGTFGGPVWEYTWDSASGAYNPSQVSSLSTAVSFEVLCAGAGRNDGVQRIYAWGDDGLYEFSYGAGTWTHLVLSSVAFGSTRSYEGTLVIADGREDGVLRLYSSDVNGVGEYTYSGAGWAKTALITSKSAGGVSIGDGRNDGVNRVYVSSNYNLYEYSAGKKY